MIIHSFRKLFVLLLTVVLAVSFSMSAVRASDMPAKMSAHVAMASFERGDCDHTLAGKVKLGVCNAVCAASLVATLAQPVTLSLAAIPASVPIPEDEFFRGAKPPPERYPPKSI